MGEEKFTSLKAMYVAYIEVYAVYIHIEVYVVYRKYIQRPKLQRTLNQHKMSEQVRNQYGI